MLNRRLGGAIFGSACLATALSPATAVSAGPPLRYHLEAGDQLVYERRVQVAALEGPSAPQRYTQQIQLWCLGSDWRETLLLADLVRVVDGRAGPTRGALFHADPRGRRRFPDEVLARVAGLDPIFELIPIMPPTLEAGPTWLTQPDRFGRRWRCTRAASDPPAAGPVRVDFVLEDPTGVAEVRGATGRGSYWFDPQAGVVVRVESEQHDRSTQQRVLVATRLHTRLKHEPYWCQQRVKEADRYLRTLRLEDRLLDQVTREPDRTEQILRQIDRLWSGLLLEMPPERKSPFRRLAQAQLTLLAEKTDSYRERAEHAGQWLGKSAAHWSLQTPDGETIRSETLRDRIVVECFWSADSLWSLRSFETLRQVQERLAAEDFRVVCLNIDADAAGSRQAARLCGAGLTHLLAGPPVGGQPPGELPVFRILDPDSKILGVYFGWQPALAEKVGSLEG